jgi:hypothetical protein
VRHAIFYDNCASRDNASIADSDACQNSRSSAQPHAVAYPDWQSRTMPCSYARIGEVVSACNEVHIESDADVASDDHVSPVVEETSRVDRGARPNPKSLRADRDPRSNVDEHGHRYATGPIDQDAGASRHPDRGGNPVHGDPPGDRFVTASVGTQLSDRNLQPGEQASAARKNRGFNPWQGRTAKTRETSASRELAIERSIGQLSAQPLWGS